MKKFLPLALLLSATPSIAMDGPPEIEKAVSAVEEHALDKAPVDGDRLANLAELENLSKSMAAAALDDEEWNFGRRYLDNYSPSQETEEVKTLLRKLEDKSLSPAAKYDFLQQADLDPLNEFHGFLDKYQGPLEALFGGEIEGAVAAVHPEGSGDSDWPRATINSLLTPEKIAAGNVIRNWYKGILDIRQFNRLMNSETPELTNELQHSDD